MLTLSLATERGVSEFVCVNFRHSLLHYRGIHGVYAQWMVGLVQRWHTQWEPISLHCE